MRFPHSETPHYQLHSSQQWQRAGRSWHLTGSSWNPPWQLAFCSATGFPLLAPTVVEEEKTGRHGPLTAQKDGR